MTLTETQRQWALIIAAILIGITVAGYKIYSVLLPAASEYIAHQIPAEIYQSIGESTLKNLDESEFSESSIAPTEQQRLNDSFQQLLQTLDVQPNKFRLHFRDWKGKMNAFALMDGSIVVTDTLIEALESEPQRNAVLLHEIGHISNNHLMKKTVQISLFYITMSLVFGDISVASDLLIESTTMGLDLSYSREFERQADMFATDKLRQIYGSPDAMIEALHHLKNENNEGEEGLHWLSTHPSFSDRISSINQQ